MLRHDHTRRSSVDPGLGAEIVTRPRLTVVVNNAGVTDEASLTTTPTPKISRHLRQLMDVNAFAAAELSSAAIREMAWSGGGAVINVGSIHARRAAPGTHVFYGMTKAALEVLTRNSAVEAAPYNVQVIGVNPGLVLTRRILEADWYDAAAAASEIPSGKPTHPRDIAALISILKDPAARLLTSTTLDASAGVANMLGGGPGTSFVVSQRTGLTAGDEVQITTARAAGARRLHQHGRRHEPRGPGSSLIQFDAGAVARAIVGARLGAGQPARGPDGTARGKTA